MPNQIVDWKHQVIDQADFYWEGYFFSRIQDLGDEEYFWEPVDNCWTVHPADDGTFWLDIQRHPAPDPEPFTTIAWRISHLIKVFGQRSSRQFGDNSFDGEKFQVFGTAKEAIAELGYRRTLWREGLLALTEEKLGRPTGSTGGPIRARSTGNAGDACPPRIHAPWRRNLSASGSVPLPGDASRVERTFLRSFIPCACVQIPRQARDEERAGSG